MLENADILSECWEGEECLAIVPSRRLTAEAFLDVLKANGISARPLAQGTGTVQDATGSLYRVDGVMLIALPEDAVRLAQRTAQLCGIASGKILT